MRNDNQGSAAINSISESMKGDSGFHVLTVGFGFTLLRNFLDPVAERSAAQFSNLLHPRIIAEEVPSQSRKNKRLFFRESLKDPMPPANRTALATLEREGVPTVNNMILGDRVVSKLSSDEALSYATFLMQRLVEIYSKLRPSVVITGFDAVHGSMALAVAKKMQIPVFVLNFSVIPRDMACFCEGMHPAARVVIKKHSEGQLRKLAEDTLTRFEENQIKAHAFIPEPLQSLPRLLKKIPKRLSVTIATIQRSRVRQHIKYTEKKNSYSVLEAITYLYQRRSAVRDLARFPLRTEVPSDPFVVFGFHLQPESSVDVWAPFFSNQSWVAELLSRSVPPTHKILIKIHKSDVSSRSRRELQKLSALPGVELVDSQVDSIALIKASSLVVSIQGTMGLEGALMGKPVVMLGDSPVSIFPSASSIGALRDFPTLLRAKLGESPPDREQITQAFANYLAPFFDASINLWQEPLSSGQIEGYCTMFRELEVFLTTTS